MSLYTQSKKTLSIKELALFAMLGTIMFTSKIIMEVLPNVHLLASLTMTYTVVFRKKALIPIYVFVILTGLWFGFATWWLPYLYIWTVLWGITMLLPRNMPQKCAVIVYPLVCSLHGLAYGTLYAPAQALLFGLDFKGMLLWIVAGFPWDIVQALGNIVAGLIIFPLSEALSKLQKNIYD